MSGDVDACVSDGQHRVSLESHSHDIRYRGRVRCRELLCASEVSRVESEAVAVGFGQNTDARDGSFNEAWRERIPVVTAHTAVANCVGKLLWLQLKSLKLFMLMSLPQFCGSWLGKWKAGNGAMACGELKNCDGAEVYG